MWFWKRRERNKEKALTKFQEGNRFLVSGQCEQAIECFVAHAVAEPGDAPKCYAKAAEAATRSNALVEPVEVAPGLTLVGMGNLALAETFFRKALELNPSYFPALAGLASILPDGHPERLKLLERAAALRDDLLVLLALGEHFLRRDPSKARELFGRARDHNPLDKSAYDGLIAACLALGEHGEADLWRERWREAYARKRKPRVDGRRHEA